LAALKGIARTEAQPASVTVRFTLSTARTSATAIPSGTRVAADEVYFASEEYNEIAAGDTYIDIDMICTSLGDTGNGFTAGEITTLVDPIAYVTSVVNTTSSSGGSEIESDEDLAERIYLAPSSYSVAGPGDAYVYWAKKYSSNIADVCVTSPSACEIDIRFILEDGEIPDDEIIQGLQKYLEDEKIRPLTDQVTVAAPDLTSYSISLTYYINKSDTSKAASIQYEVNTAISNYITWQSSVIGRDINPSELTKRVVAAGAKRVEIATPEYMFMDETAVANLSSKSITYGGLEND
jgi:phage-related baseplate assembly protein